MRDNERPEERKKPRRKAETHPKGRIAWPRWTGFRNKTVWDWLQLLIVPLMLVAIGFWFTTQQDARQQRIEDQRAEAERELAQQRAQDEALQAYLDQMTALLLDKDLRNSEEDSEVRTVARARTLTISERLDSERKFNVVQFLHDAHLIQEIKGKEPIISLSGVNLEGISVTFADFSGAHLAGANLYEANLNSADLNGADLFNANLVSTSLRSADLRGADLLQADLSNADLSNTNLSGANLNDSLLHGTDLSDADLRGAKLIHANLSDAELRDANLSDADLGLAQEITPEQLEKQVESLKGATMPNGQKYEDWLKSKGRGEDKSNSSP